VAVMVIQYGITKSISYIHFQLNFKVSLKRQYFQTTLVKVVSLILMIMILMLGTAETIQFYLTNGSYFWFAILSFGFYLLLFFLPWLNLRLPYQKRFNLSMMLLFNLSTGTVLLWIIALINAPNRIYLDEGGVNSRPTNFMLKVITIVLLSAFYLVSLWLLVRAEQRYQTEHLQIEGQRPVSHSESTLEVTPDVAQQALEAQLHGRPPLAAKKIAIRFSTLPTLFVLMMLLLEQLLNDGSPQLLRIAPLAVAIITGLINLLSLIFLGEHQRRVRIVALVVYTLLSLLNLAMTHPSDLPWIQHVITANTGWFRNAI